MENIKTFEDVLTAAKAKPELYKHLLPQGTTLEDFIKYPGNRVQLLVAVLNDGWKPNWSDYNENKYYPWFNMNDSSAPLGFSYIDFVCDYTDTNLGARLCYKNRELAKYAGTQFLELYRDFMVIE